MLIEFIKLRNFRSYVSARIEFSAGIIAILGENWVGKTSLLLALGFAVFNHRIGKLAEYLREGTKEGGVTVGLLFSPGEQRYQVRRHFNAKTTTLYEVHGPDGICASGVGEVQAWLRERLGVSPGLSLSVLFESTIGVPQGTLTAPFLLSPGPRKEFFEPLLEVRDWQKASKELQPAARVLTEQIRKLEAKADRANGQLMVLPALKEEFATVDALIDLLGLEIPGLQAAADVHHRALDKMVAVQLAVVVAEAQAKEAKARVDTHRPSVGEAEQAVVSALLAASVVEANSSAYHEYQSAEGSLLELEKSRERYDKLLTMQAQLRTQVALAGEARTREEELEREYEQTHDQVAELKKGIARRPEYLASLAHLGPLISEQRRLLNYSTGKTEVAGAEKIRLTEQANFLLEGHEDLTLCPTCGMELTRERKDEVLKRNTIAIQLAEVDIAVEDESVMRCTQEILRLQELYGEAQHEMDSLPQEEHLDRALEVLAKQMNALKVLEGKVLEGTAYTAALGRVNYSLSTEFGDLSAMLSRFQAQRNSCRGGYQLCMTNFPRANRLQDWQDKLKSLQSIHRELQEEAKRLYDEAVVARKAYDREKHARIQTELTALQKKVTVSETTLQEKKERRIAIVSQLIALKEVQATRIALVSKLKGTRETHETLQWIRGLLREAGPLITRRLVRQISQGASEIYQDLTGDPSRSLRWSQDYGLFMSIGGHERNFASQLSGGEQICAALALRLSLLKETSAVDIVLFDEPTMFLDPRRCDNLAEAVARIRGFAQVIIISHKEVFERTVDSFVRIVIDETGSHPVP